jgi:chemotaxis protein MotB
MQEHDRVAHPREHQVATMDVRQDRRPPRSRAGAVGWILLLLVLALGAGAYVLLYAPLEKNHHRLARELRAARGEAASARQRLGSTTAEAERARGELGALREERDRLLSERTDLASTVAERDEAIARLQAAQSAIEARMHEEIEHGDILVRNTNGELRVELTDKILFASGDADLSPRGRAVLRRVAETLATLEDQMIQVSGHTDSLPLSERIQERFPTNWELSTTRATNVVRFLSEECDVPPGRLFAAGFSQHHPVARNTNAAGRRRNRRIELTLRRIPND